MEQRFEKIIDNPLFFKWIFNPDADTVSFWEDYLEKHPEEKDFILNTKLDLERFAPKNEVLSVKEKERLSSEIVKALDKEDRKKQWGQRTKTLLNYAAVAILFSCIGGLLVYWQFASNSSEKGYEELVMAPVQVDEPTLILSESDKIGLHNDESTVDYSHQGEIILNNDQIIKSKTRTPQEAKINQLVIPFGSRSQIVLSDGTKVWLNAGSRLIYPSAFIQKTREVTLYGEAYFEVAHNKNQPFIVKTTSLDVRVLGTEFNVSAYPDDKIIQTVLKEGSVAIRKNDASLFEKDLILKPNQLTAFHKDTETSAVYNVNADDYIIWTQGLLKFEDENLSRVIKRVERFYNTWISYENPELGTIKVTGKLDLHQGVDEVVEYLAKVSRNEYVKISKNKYLLK